MAPIKYSGIGATTLVDYVDNNAIAIPMQCLRKGHYFVQMSGTTRPFRSDTSDPRSRRHAAPGEPPVDVQQSPAKPGISQVNSGNSRRPDQRWLTTLRHHRPRPRRRRCPRGRSGSPCESASCACPCRSGRSAGAFHRPQRSRVQLYPQDGARKTAAKSESGAPDNWPQST